MSETAQDATVTTESMTLPVVTPEQQDLHASSDSATVSRGLTNQSESPEDKLLNNSEKDSQENTVSLPGQTVNSATVTGRDSVEPNAQVNLLPTFVQPEMEMPISTHGIPPQHGTDPAAAQVSPIPRVASHLSPTDNLSPEQADTRGEPVKKTKRRGSAWTDDQTFFLMEIWARHTDASGNEEYSITNAPIYRIISRSMNELGYIDKTSDQCKCRIHTLKRAYKITKAEIEAGAQNITFCRHYDKLKIIHGDDPSMTPKQLAEVLAEQRRAKGHAAMSSEAKPKKLKPSPNHKVKRAQSTDSSSQDTTPPKQAYESSTQPPPQIHVEVPPLPGVSSLWNYAALKFPLAATSTVQQPSTINTANQLISPVNTQNISYQNNVKTTSPNTTYDVNHNTFVVVKKEKQEPQDEYSSYQSSVQKISEPPTSQTKEEIERMRLDLEIKKIEIERNRLEMEERQRREDRDHQYRMMQLLLVGLGHNPTLGSLGSDSEEGHQPELSRALEGGLVPGGTQSANEKGLSFSEI